MGDGCEFGIRSVTCSCRPPRGIVMGFDPDGGGVSAYEAGNTRVRTRNRTKEVFPAR